jgi:predicted nuclease of predicted toxin-antitoxin system
VGEGRLIVTNDKDFGELIFRSGQAHHGVLLLRLHDESPPNRVRVVKSVLEQYSDRLVGCFTVATEIGVRIRPGS